MIANFRSVISTCPEHGSVGKRKTPFAMPFAPSLEASGNRRRAGEWTLETPSKSVHL